MFKLTFVALGLVSLAILQPVPSYAKKAKDAGILKQVRVKTICPNSKKNLGKVLSIVSAVDLTLRYTHGRIGLLEIQAKQLKKANKILMKRLTKMDQKLTGIFKMVRKAINAGEPKPKSITICEGKNATLNCRGGTKIVILQANYGRMDNHTCPGGPIHTTKCKASASLALVRRACQGKPSCLLLSNNSVFGDPCKGTYKYLQVKYKCHVYEYKEL